MSTTAPYRLPRRPGDRRRHVRVPVVTSATAHADGLSFPATLLDLSAGGAAAEVEWRHLRAPRPAGLGVGSRVRIDLPRFSVRGAEAIVRRVEPEPAATGGPASPPAVVLGLEFERLERDVAYRLLAHRLRATPLRPA